MNIKKSLPVILLFFATGALAQQADLSLIPYRRGDLWGYAKADLKVIITPKFAEAGLFSEGLASVKMGNKYGYINQLGQVEIPAKYTVARPFRKGYVPDLNKAGGDSILFAGVSLTENGTEICIDKNGKTLFKCPAINENSVIENEGPVGNVVKQKNYTLKNNNGLFDKVMDDYQVAGSDETFYIAVKNDLFGVFNTKYDTIVPFVYQSIKVNRLSSTPFLEVNKGGLSGILKTDGKEIFAPKFQKLLALKITDGDVYVIARKDEQSYLKDVNNLDILPKSYSDIAFDQEGFILTGEDGLKGYYILDKNTINPKYRELNRIAGTRYLFVKTTSGKPGYINTAGEEFFTE